MRGTAMKKLKCIIPALLLAGLTQTGCVLTSAQVLTTFEFDDPVTISGPTALIGQAVDLNTISEYQDHKDKIQSVADLALLGQFENLGSTDIQLEVLMTTD